MSDQRAQQNQQGGKAGQQHGGGQKPGQQRPNQKPGQAGKQQEEVDKKNRKIADDDTGTPPALAPKNLSHGKSFFSPGNGASVFAATTSTQYGRGRSI